jgi:aminopeptidase-like protein
MISTVIDQPDAEAAADSRIRGDEMHSLLRRLYPICRSITGDGVRETLRILAERIPLRIHEVPSGTPVFDWTVPPEWSIRGATVVDPGGNVILDFADSTLHVMGYSEPIDARMPLDVLLAHLHSIESQPDVIPYRTSFYRRTWGLCASHRLVESLQPGEYDVRIDSSLFDGSLTYGELRLPGDMSEEILISTHVCHPSLANDNLSGIVVAAALAEELGRRRHRLSYRFVFVPSTIGALTWLSRNVDALPRFSSGLVIAGVGDAGAHTYKRSRDGGRMDRIVIHALETSGRSHAVVDFVPWGYDERQYNSPGIGLSVGLLSRTPHGTYPEYHTSADDPDFVQPTSLDDTLELCRTIIDTLDGDRTYVNRSPMGEPQLGRRGLYALLGGTGDIATAELASLWVLNLSDGQHSLFDIAERAGLPFPVISAAAEALESAELLRPVTGSSSTVIPAVTDGSQA